MLDAHAGDITGNAELLRMTDRELERPGPAGQLADGSARLVTALLSFVLAVALMVGPIIWALGKANGDDVSFDGGPLRLVAQLALAALFARVASRRSRGFPVFGTPAR